MIGLLIGAAIIQLLLLLWINNKLDVILNDSKNGKVGPEIAKMTSDLKSASDPLKAAVEEANKEKGK